MSELSRTILSGTNQIADAMAGLAAARRESRKRKSDAARATGESLADLGTTLKQYGDMRRARLAEDDTKQVNDAYGLGMTTKGPQGALVALGAVRPRTAAGATLLATRSEAAQDLVRRQDNSRLLEAQAHHMDAMDKEAAKERERAEKARTDLRRLMSEKRDTTDYATDPRFNTTLLPMQEGIFQVWKRKYAPDDSGADYDLRGAFKAGLTPGEDGHWPDAFKKPNHPTFSNESRYAELAPDRAGSWDQAGNYVPPDPDEQDLAQAREAVALGALDFDSYLKLRAQVTATRKARADDERRRTELQTKVGLEREKIASKEKIAAENAGLQRDRLDAMKSARENAAQVAADTLALRREFMSQAAAIAQNRALRESLRERLRAQVESINRIDKQIILQKAWAEEDGADALKQALDDAVLARDDILQQLDAAAELEIPQGVQAQAPSAPVAPPDLTPDEQAIFDSMSPEEQQAFVEELSR